VKDEERKSGVAAAAGALREHSQLSVKEIEAIIARHCVGAERLAAVQQQVNLLRDSCAWAVEMIDTSGSANLYRFSIPRRFLERLRGAWHATR